MDDVQLTDEESLLIIHRLHQVIRPFLLRRKKQEVEKELPDKDHRTLKCDMSAWQKRYYRSVTEKGKVAMEHGSKGRALMNSAMQLRKVCIHPYLFLDNQWLDPEDPVELIRASGKFELLDRVLPKLRASGHRVLLFSQMTNAMNLIEDYLVMKGFKYLRLDGETKTELRPQMIQQFNAPDSDIFIFILSTRAGGLGLNLQTADTVIMFDNDWNPQMDKQAEDRAHRIGQKKEVRIFVFVSVGTIEEVILEKAREKSEIDNKVIQAGMFNQTSVHADRAKVLESILRKAEFELGNDIPSHSEINSLLARNDEEFEQFERMDAESIDPSRPRLMQEDELPSYVVEFDQANKTPEKRPADALLEPRRARAKNIVYSEALTDTQWLKLVDGGADHEEIAVADRQKRRRRASNGNGA